MIIKDDLKDKKEIRINLQRPQTHKYTNVFNNTILGYLINI